MHLNHPETIPSTPGLWKNCLPGNQSLVPKSLGTAEKSLGQMTPFLKSSLKPEQSESLSSLDQGYMYHVESGQKHKNQE